MVAVVAGNGLGLFNTSLNNLGGGGVLGQGGFGQAGGQALVNAQGGNLVLQFTDRQLSGLGLDLLHTRTYNTQGTYNDADGDGWRWDGERRVVLNGELNAAGSSVLRTTGDGHETLYRWNGSTYQSSDGDGAHDSLSWDAARSEWVWIDGSRRTVERYEGASGRLVQVTDVSGTRIDYSYDANGRLSSVKDASGQELVLVYNAAGKLERLDTRAITGGLLTQQVYYSYDAQGRLSSVVTDLTPSDNSTSDGKVYTTTYTYDGASFRIASVSQSDGTSVSFTYELVDGEYRVKKVTDASGTTTFSYDLANRRTDITNGLNQQWSYFYDTEGRLLEVQTPAVNGQRLSTRYAYDADGNVSQVTDGRGNAISYDYDANGNRVLERDAQGNTLRRTYSAANQLFNEIRYSQPAVWNGSAWTEPPASTAQVLRYAYDSNNRLRYLVSATGVVSEYRYNGLGLRTQEVTYGDARYPLTGLAEADGLSEAQLSTWTAARNKSQTSLTELSYDYRGNLTRSTRYAAVSAAGAGILSAATTVTEYIYSERGELLQTIAVRGTDRTAKTTLSSFVYDGLGRLLSQVDGSGTRTYAYNGVARSVAVSNSAGLTQTQVFDAQGRLLTLTESGAGVATRSTQYRYDGAGRLRMVQDATGVRSYTFYDEAGRVSAQVDGTGAVTEFIYNATGQKTREVRYATLASTSTWYSSGVFTKSLVSEIRPTFNAATDRTSNYAYDEAGRLSSSTDALGYVTTYSYDGRGQLVQVQNGDRITRTFYDADGRTAGVLDAEGYLRENVYDAAGRLSRSVRYAIATTSTLRATGTLDQLRPASTGALQAYYFYDAAGRQIGSVDEQQFVSETVYDDAGNRQQTIRYATVYTAAVGSDFAVIRTAVAAGTKQISIAQYDGFGRVSQRIAIDGTVTIYEYDSAGRLVREIRAQGTSEERSTRWRYDVLGQTLGQLTGEGAVRITAGMTEAQIQATYAQYGLTYAYDVAGRQLSVTDAAGNKIVSYYDAAGRLTHTVNKLGEVTETVYNVFGEALNHTRFIDRLSSATTAGLTGGLLTTPLSVLTQAMRDNVANSSTSNTYDLRGQRTGSTDAVGYLTSYGYSRHGEQVSVTSTIEKGATPKTTTTTLSYNKRSELIGRLEDSAGLKRSTATSYDAFGRVITRTDGRGLTSTTRYDSNGRMVVVSNPLNQSEITEYDAFARVFKQTDALGRVTSYSYDDAARTLTMTMPGGVTLTTTLTRHGETLSLKDGKGQVTQYSYNKDGQLLTTLNALNQTSTQGYDAAGRKISVTDAAGNTTRYSYDVAGRVLTVTDANSSVTRYVLDGMGRKMRSIEAEGQASQRITDYAYDCVDQVVSVTQDPDGLKLNTTYAYDGLGRQLQVSRGTVDVPNQQVTRYEFDNLGRRTAEVVDPDGLQMRTEYRYNKNDQIEQKIQVLNASTRYTTTYVYDDAGRLLSTTDAAGKKESYTYDAVGNRKTLTNKNGAVWTYNYDSRNRLVEEITPLINVASIDATGSVTTGNHHLVTLLGYDAVGNVISRSEGRLRAAPGNAASSDNLSQARTTSYGYDALNRQVRITSPGWYNKTTGAFQASGDGTGNTFQVTTDVTYDAAGNAVRNRVRVNNSGNAATDFVDSFKIYDKLGRVTYEVDALNGVTGYTYDAVGNQITTKRYANGLSAALPSRGYYLASDITSSTLVADAAMDRTLTSAYDKAGRKVSVQQDLVSIYTFTGSVASSTLATLAPTTVYTYDALGRVIKETQIGRRADGTTQITGASTTYYYDKAGNRTGMVNAMGYYTRMEYDGMGRLTRQREYSTALASWSESSLPTPPVATLDDRSTLYSYDAMGRLIQTTRENVRYWVQDATDFGGLVTSKEVRGNLIESKLTYDNVGNIKTVTDALGNVTTTEYNALGQVSKLTEPVRWAAKAGAVDPFIPDFSGIVLASPTTTYAVNAFGQVVQETQRAGIDSQGIAQSGWGKVSRTVYDAAGYEVKSLDALNAVETYKIDVAGRRIEEFQQTSMTLNAWTWLDGNKFQYNRDIKRTFEYNKLGQQTATIAWYGDWDGQTKAAKDSVEYNRFGEATAKRMNGQILALYNYDQLGRLGSSADMQQWIVVRDYDLAGNLTRSNQIGELWGSADDDRITYIRYDQLGRAIEQHLPAFSANTSADTLNNVTLTKVTPVIRQAFDRWGNVTQRTDARGGASLYSYDHNNRVWAETAPTTDILRENGTSYRASIMQQRHYDAVGRQIAEQDWVWPYAGSTNFTLLRTRHHVYNQVGDMNRDVDALGYTRTYLTDAYGNRVATKDAVGVVTVDSYDAMDRHTSHGIIRGGAKFTLLTNRYDQAGRLVAEINGVSEIEESAPPALNSGAILVSKGNTRYTLRDAIGNIQWTRNESGIQMRYGYDAYSRKINEWDGLGGNQSWTYTLGDWSRLSSRKDLGGRVFTYSYNLFGQVAKETYFGADQGSAISPANSGGIQLDRKYGYYENGLLQSISDIETEGGASGGILNVDISSYDYDQAGNRTKDASWKYQQWIFSPDPVTTSNAVRDVRYRYDEQGRIKEIKMPAGSSLVGSTDYDPGGWEMYTAMGTGKVDYLAYDYDELGNRRRVRLDTTNQSNTRTVIDNWYKYDTEGRVLVADGYVNTSGKVVAGQVGGKAKGTAMAYGASGLRMSAIKWAGTFDTLNLFESQQYSYNDLGLVLSNTKRTEAGGGPDSSFTLSTEFTPAQSVFSNTYDGFGLRTSQTAYTSSGAFSSLTNYSYRGDGQLATQLLYKKFDGVQRLSQATYFNETDMLDAAGNQRSYRYVMYKSSGAADYSGKYVTDYAAFDSYKELKTTATMSKSSTPGVSTSRYTDRGELLQVEGTGASKFTRKFASNREGQLITVEQSGKAQSHIYFNGREVANIGNANTVELTDTVLPINKDTFGLAPRSHVVSEGDTLQSIALQVWGDDAMWYLIADANGLVGGEALTAGDSLKIPNVLGATHNDANDFKPYNPDDVIGNTTPSPKPKPPKKKKKKSGGLGSVVMVVVAVVAAVFTAGAAAAAFATIGTSVGMGGAALAGGLSAIGIGTATSVGIGAAIAGGVVGGAVGSAAGQLAGMAMGVVDSFSWSQVAAGALTGGIASGMGAAAQGLMGSTAQGAASVVNSGYVSQGVFSYVSSYAVNKVVGLEASFSWKGMAASLIGSYVGGQAGEYAGRQMPGLARSIVAGQVSAATSATVNDKWFGGGRPDYGQVAVDAFGNTLASYLKEQMGKTEVERVKPQAASASGSSDKTLAEMEHDLQGMGRALAEWDPSLDEGGIGEYAGDAFGDLAVVSGGDSGTSSASANVVYLAETPVHAAAETGDNFAESWDGMRSYWSSVQDQAVIDGNPYMYVAAHGMSRLGDVGYGLAEMGRALWNSPGEGFKGAVKSLTTNFGPELFNLGTNLVKTSANGWTLLAEEVGIPSGSLAGFRETDAYNIPLLAPYENTAQEGGALLGGLVGGGTIAKFGRYGLTAESISARGLGRYQAGAISLRFYKSNGDVLQGGAYGRLLAGDDIERHHMPANSVSPLSTYRGPAIRMSKIDHEATSSYGSKIAAVQYREAIASMIAAGQWRKAMAVEVRDARRVAAESGNLRKYNSAMQEMLDYTKSRGLLDKQ